MVSTVKTNPQTQLPEETGAINGDISKRNEHFKTPSIVMNVDSIDEHLQKIESAGGKVILPKTPVADMGFHAMFSDTEGNTLGLWEDAKNS